MNNKDPETTKTWFTRTRVTAAVCVIALGFLALAALTREGVLNRLRMLGQQPSADPGAPPPAAARDSSAAAPVVR